MEHVGTDVKIITVDGVQWMRWSHVRETGRFAGTVGLILGFLVGVASVLIPLALSGEG